MKLWLIVLLLGVGSANAQEGHILSDPLIINSPTSPFHLLAACNAEKKCGYLDFVHGKAVYSGELAPEEFEQRLKEYVGAK